MCNWARGTVLKGLGKREPKNSKPKVQEEAQEETAERPRWRARRWRLTAPDRVDVRFAREEDS